MKILVTGSHGLIGTALTPALESNGHDVVRLVRSEAKDDERTIQWNPERGSIEKANLEGFGAVVHLAGESIAEGRWTDEKKARIRTSRVKGTRLLSETLAQLETKPEVLLSASAIGFYGDRGDEILIEESAPGTDFLSEVCKEWEEATGPASDARIRVVNLRFGIVLSKDGGALAKMLTPFQMGAGGKIGSGKQYMSWVTVDDVVGSILHAITNRDLRGAVNVVAPAPATNAEFTKALGRVLSRPTLLSVPAFAARLAFGEMADALLLSSARVQPAKLQQSGYEFKHTQLEGALRHVLQK